MPLQVGGEDGDSHLAGASSLEGAHTLIHGGVGEVWRTRMLPVGVILMVRVEGSSLGNLACHLKPRMVEGLQAEEQI
jgi:hypothetical protein